MSQPTTTERAARDYVLSKQSDLNHPDAFPLIQQAPAAHYRPLADWLGRLILPERMQRRDDRGVWFEVYHAPEAQRALVGCRVWLRWSTLPPIQSRVWSVTKDVLFTEKTHASLRDGLVLPERVNGWLTVGPLESLAGSHPTDDVIVALRGPVEVIAADGAPDAAELIIRQEPVQVTGRFRALVRFVGPADDGGDGYRVVHFNRATRQFDGPEEVVRLPHVIPNENDVLPATREGIEDTPLNADGWYITGAQDQAGVFVVQTLAPRRLLRVQPERVITEPRAARAYLKQGAWHDMIAQPGAVQSVLLSPGAASAAEAAAAWQEGDRALVLHVFGGIGGEKTEPPARGPVYFGHFAYGVAQVVREPLADELVFDITYAQVYTHNGEGLIAGLLDWSRYMGDRQYGWLGMRPVCDVLIKLDAFTEAYELYGMRYAALDVLLNMLQMMTARYRIGDGRGATYVAAANNCSQDSNQALYAAIKGIERLVTAHPDVQAWLKANPAEAQRFERLLSLGTQLQRRLLPFGAARADWQYNAQTLGMSLEDSPLRNLLTGLRSWCTMLPRVANNTVGSVFLQAGATAWVLSTSQVGGPRADIAPVAPLAFVPRQSRERTHENAS
jgi:predicted Abi (CAAX) family protease